jgi:hypothetical protein
MNAKPSRTKALRERFILNSGMYYNANETLSLEDLLNIPTAIAPPDGALQQMYTFDESFRNWNIHFAVGLARYSKLYRMLCHQVVWFCCKGDDLLASYLQFDINILNDLLLKSTTGVMCDMSVCVAVQVFEFQVPCNIFRQERLYNLQDIEEFVKVVRYERTRLKDSLHTSR